MEPDVLVVGAGPAGAAVSILLTRQGYRVLLVDRATFPPDKACAEYLSPACTSLLTQRGYCGWRCWRFCLAEGRAVLAFCPACLCVKMTYNDIGHASPTSGMAS